MLSSPHKQRWQKSLKIEKKNLQLIQVFNKFVR